MPTIARTSLIFSVLLMIPAGFAVAQTASSGQAAMTSAGDQPNAPTNRNTPGATGETIVRGDKSTINGDRPATRLERAAGEIENDH